MSGGFGGGGYGGSGGGLGGAIFNHRGTLSLTDVTVTNNSAVGGGGTSSGSGLGSAIFNLNGAVTIQFSTLANNSVDGSNGNGSNGSGDATVYSLAYGNMIEDGTASNATLTIVDSIVAGTTASNGAGNNDVVSLAVNGNQTNTAALTYADANLVGLSSGTSSGPAPLTTAPNLGALADNGGPTQTMRPLGGSPAIDAVAPVAGQCAVSVDQRGVSRPQGAGCDIGAVEFDRIFADNFEGTPTP